MLIDTPPFLTATIADVIAAADLVLIPVRPSPNDLRAVCATVELAKRARRRMVFVVSQATQRARITAQRALDVLIPHIEAMMPRSAKQTTAKRDMRRARRFLGGSVPFGYRIAGRGSLEPVPEQQDAIRQMQELRAQGLAIRAIAAQMEAKGHKLSHMTVHKILPRAAGMNGSAGP